MEIPTTMGSKDQRLKPLPKAESQAIANVRSALEWDRKVGGWSFTERYLWLVPNEAQRGWLMGRARLLETWLRPAGDDRTRAQIVSLGATMKHREHGSDTAAILKTYMASLAGVPAYGLIEACQAFRLNQVGDGWMPTPGDLHQEAQLRAAWATAELSDIHAILGANVPPKREPIEHRRAVAAEMRRRVGIGGHDTAA